MSGRSPRFADEHPASDYAPEAARSVRAMQLRNSTRFGRVGVVVDVNSSTPAAERLRRVFRDRAATAYAAAGMATETLADAESARESNIAALLTIRHDERETSAELEKGRMTGPAIVARTEVKLERVDGSKPIWSDSFEYRVPLSARRDDVSILFGPGSASSYWADPDGEFFVPIARWSTEVLARPSRAFSKPAIAVDVAGTRAVVVFGDGDFQVFDLSDPANLVMVAEYRRDRDLARFEGVRIEGSNVAVFGSDGIELVRLDGEDARRERAWGRDRVGSVVDAESIDGEWLLATNRGSSAARPGFGPGSDADRPTDLGNGARIGRSNRLHGRDLALRRFTADIAVRPRRGRASSGPWIPPAAGPRQRPDGRRVGRAGCCVGGLAIFPTAPALENQRKGRRANPRRFDDRRSAVLDRAARASGDGSEWSAGRRLRGCGCAKANRSGGPTSRDHRREIAAGGGRDPVRHPVAGVGRTLSANYRAGAPYFTQYTELA